MSYLPTKRQRSNTSRESSNAIPQTTAPALRQHPSLNSGLAIYPTAATTSGYGNGPYVGATQPTAASPAHHHHQGVTYASYSAGPVTTQHSGYGGGGYQSSASAAGYGSTPYSPQHQTNPYANQYTHAQASPQLSPHAGHYAPAGLGGVQSSGYTQTHTHNPQAAARMTYSPVSANPQTASYNQPPSQRGNAAIATMQNQPQHGALAYADSYSSHTPTHSGQFHATPPSYQDPSVATHYSPAPLPTPQSHDVSRHMSEDLTENCDEDAQGEPADESTEMYTNPEPPRPPVSSIPTPSADQSKPGDMSCSCKKGRGKKKACVSCGCSKYGLSCTASCSCGTSCGNPFADLSAFFGSSDIFPSPCGASLCFATWITHQPNVEELDAELMVDMLLSDDESWAQIRGYTEGFKEWEDQWKKAGNGKSKKSKDERERLEFELLRAGLGNGRPEEGFNGYRYSFCQGQWVPTHLWDHCVECQICRSSDDWHCHKHERCTEGRVCSGCASTTLPYHPQQQQQPRESMYSAQGS